MHYMDYPIFHHRYVCGNYYGVKSKTENGGRAVRERLGESKEMT